MQTLILLLAVLALLSGTVALLFAGNLIYGLFTGAFDDGRGMAIVVLQTWGGLGAIAAIVTGSVALLAAKRTITHSATSRHCARLAIVLGMISLLTIAALPHLQSAQRGYCDGLHSCGTLRPPTT